MMKLTGILKVTVGVALVLAASHSVWAADTDSPLIKMPFSFGRGMENTPVIYDDRPLLIANYRPTGPSPEGTYLSVTDLRTGQEVSRFGEGHSFVSAFVRGKELHVWASEYTEDWALSIYHFVSTDLKTWSRALAIPREGDEHLFNCSVCEDGQGGYVMAYESNQPVQFCFKFARSKDLVTWEKIPGLVFTGEHNEYSACPVLRYFAPYYYVIYLHAAVPGHNGWVSFMARSKDLETWELTPKNPILEAGPGEGKNSSDVDLFEYQGNTYLYYATGDQATWGALNVAMCPGPMKAFYESYFPKKTDFTRISTKRE